MCYGHMVAARDMFFLSGFAVFVKLSSCSVKINTPSTAVCLSRALNFPAGFSATLVPARIWLVKLWVGGKCWGGKEKAYGRKHQSKSCYGPWCYSCPKLSLLSGGKSLPQNWIQAWPWILPCFSVSQVFFLSLLVSEGILWCSFSYRVCFPVAMAMKSQRSRVPRSQRKMWLVIA